MQKIQRNVVDFILIIKKTHCKNVYYVLIFREVLSNLN